MAARIACLVALTVSIAGCGDDKLSADDLVTELNENGASLELGEPLRTDREGYEINAVRIAPDGASGSITITPDADAGLDEYERCRSAGLFVCFRADNAVLIFEESELPGDQRARIESALGALSNG